MNVDRAKSQRDTQSAHASDVATETYTYGTHHTLAEDEVGVAGVVEAVDTSSSSGLFLDDIIATGTVTILQEAG